MSSDKEFQGEETGISPNINVYAIQGLDEITDQYRDPLGKKHSNRIPEDDYSQEKEEEKDQIQEINNAHVKGNENGYPVGYSYLTRRMVRPKAYPESPRNNKQPLKAWHKMSKGIECENEVRINVEDSVDLTTMNQDTLRPGAYTPTIKSSRKKTAIPMIRPLAESRENLIQKMIEEAEPNTLIHLPAMNITLPYLHLTKPITIKGVPGSEIKITQGPILIDLQNEKNKSGDKVVFCECTIHAEYTYQRLMDNINTRSDSRRGGNTQKESEDSFKLIERKCLSSVKSDFNTIRSKLNDNSLVLFQVNSGSVLEVRDCEIKSLVKDSLLTAEEPKSLKEIQDTAFWLHNENEALENPVVMISSTTMAGFHTFLYSEPGCSSSVSRCFISSSRGHALNFENPKTVKISNNVFEKTTKSAVNMKFPKEFIDDKIHNIIIKNNEIIQSSSYGISIFGEHLKPLNLSILIDYNKISHSKKDSIGIKFLNIHELKISHNEIRYSKGNGVSLQNVFDSRNSTQIYLRKNNIQLCEGNGFVLKDCPVLMENEEIVKNNKNGLFIVLEESTKEGKEQPSNTQQKLDFRIIINNCKIEQNQESGINLSGSLRGPMILNSCTMSENLYGIYITEKENESILLKPTNTSIMNKMTSPTTTSPIKPKERKKSKSMSQKPGIRNPCHFSVEKCEITKNNIAGIYLKKLVSEMYAIETHVNMNKEQALFMEDFNDKELIKIKEQDRARMAEYFQGYVGGYWGELYEERPVSCKNSCKMF